MTEQTAKRPAYRQFWFWFILAPPLASVVMGLSLVGLAVSGDDSRVVDNYYQAGRSIHKDFDRERRAAALGLDSTIAVDRKDGRITVRLDGNDSLPPAVQLRLAHATHAGRDHRLELVRDETGLYRGRIGAAVTGRYYLRIEAPDDSWRINAVLDNGQNQVDASPHPPGQGTE